MLGRRGVAGQAFLGSESTGHVAERGRRPSSGWSAIGAKLSLLFSLLATPAWLAAQRPQSVRLTLGSVLARFGGGSGAGGEQFGSLNGAAVIGPGSAVLADRRNGRLVVVVATPRSVTVVGRTGSGPGEFREPRAIGLRGSHDLLVYDHGLARVSDYGIDGRSLVLKGSASVDGRAINMCWQGGSTIALAYDQATGTILRRAGPDGTITSFGDPFFGRNRRLNAWASDAELLCSDALQLTVVAPYYSERLSAYRNDGTMAWSRDLGGYVPTWVREVAGGGVAYGFPQDKTIRHIMLGVHYVGDGYLLVQLGLAGVHEHKGADLDFISIDSRLLRASDGEEVGRQADLPVILAVKGTQVITAGPEPDLWVELRALAIHVRAP